MVHQNNIHQLLSQSYSTPNSGGLWLNVIEGLGSTFFPPRLSNDVLSATRLATRVMRQVRIPELRLRRSGPSRGSGRPFVRPPGGAGLRTGRQTRERDPKGRWIDHWIDQNIPEPFILIHPDESLSRTVWQISNRIRGLLPHGSGGMILRPRFN